MKINSQKEQLLSMIRQNAPMTIKQQAQLVLNLATPAILAQLTTTMMQYIDASMVGSLGAEASAAIGLIETTTWLLGSICSACAAGFYVQVSHQLGANDHSEARNTLRQGILSVLIASTCIGILAYKSIPSRMVRRKQSNHPYIICLFSNHCFSLTCIPIFTVRFRNASQ